MMIIMKAKKIIAELSEKNFKSGLYTSKGRDVEEIAKKLNIKVEKIEINDLEKVKKILSKGEPLSKIVIAHREHK